MIAHVVFDLPLEEPFDYAIPSSLKDKTFVGVRVKVPFGRRHAMGFVVGLAQGSAIASLKEISSVVDAQPIFDGTDLEFARRFSAYYGCSLGEALMTMLRHAKNRVLVSPRVRQSSVVLHHCPGGYAQVWTDLIKAGQRVLILVPDLSALKALPLSLTANPAIRVGLRSAVFEADANVDLVIMCDEADASYKQEQSPMYETRDTLLMRAVLYRFDVAFVSVSPSVELMALVGEGKVTQVDVQPQALAKIKPVDLTNYKFLDKGILSPVVRQQLEHILKNKGKALLVLNRKGSYRVTRCVDCDHVLKCPRCDIPLAYSRLKKYFSCTHCTSQMPADTVCPTCHKPSWRSYGMGVEQIHKQIEQLFPTARIASFERTEGVTLKSCDILIATQAILRFQGQVMFDGVALVDFDSELNRMDIRSSFKAWNLARQVRLMSRGDVYVQTRNIDHYVVKSLVNDEAQLFYDQEMRLRKELGFAPFKHWVQLTLRSKNEKSSQQAAQDVYNILQAGVKDQATPPAAEPKKRDQFRFNIMVQCDEVAPTVATVKSALTKTKRNSRVITTINVDP